jgi:perosamine synthetase
MKKKIKLFDVVVNKEEEFAIQKVLKSHNWASGAGLENVLKFENEFQNYSGSDSCVSVNSGTAALHLALSMTNIKNKEVILPSLSFVSTAHAIVYNGGIPVFVDVNPETLCIDPLMISNAITKNTAAILPVHFGGMACDLNKISLICKKNGLSLIEDAAHATGTSYHKKKIGSHGDFVCFSFHPVKNLAMPTGGAITINGKQSQKFSKILKSKRWCGISDRKGVNYDVKEIGWNCYMNEFSAAIGRIQLKKLDKMNQKRNSIAKIYSEELKITKMLYDKECSYHLFWIQVNNRKKFMKLMSDNDIETGIHYKPIHKLTFYNKKINLPISEKASKNLVSIPIHPNLSDSNISKIISLTNKFS